MAVIVADLAKLDRAIGSGVLEVESQSQGRVKYRTMDDMMAARAFLAGKIAEFQPVPRTRRIVLTGQSGW